MELKRYLAILWRWWWLILVALVAAIMGSIVFTYTRPPQYQATVRLVVSPSAATTEDLGEQRASLGTLSDQPTIVNTYAEIAQSQSIIKAAWDQLGLSPNQAEAFTVSASVLHNTNILVIDVTGPDPILVEKLASAVSQRTLDYVAKLYEVYDLKPLDLATLPDKPANLNEEFNLALGALLGLGVGILFAFLAESLRTPLGQIEQVSILDTHTGAYKRTYFLRRLREEISRARRVQRPFVVGMMGLENFELSDSLPPNARYVVLKQVVSLLRQALPEENLVAQWRDDALALLMPDCDPDTAQKILQRVQTKLAWTPLEIGDTGFKLNLSAHVGIAGYNLNGSGPEDLLNQAEKALQEADPQGSLAHV
jgi:diguanylate cyclase (GGDEF)-like protein